MGKARVSAAGNTGVGVLEVTLNPEQSMSVKDLGTACLAAAQAMQPTAKADAKKSLAAAAEDLLDQLEQGNTKKSGTGEKREAQLSQYNFILVVGAQEVENGTVNVRTRDNTVHGVKTIDELIVEFTRLCDEHVLDLELDVTAEKGDAKDAKKGK